ncbi:MAG: dihydrolipoyl dehydrogenase [Chloroflexi bacterium]|nr:dihydrolipoyl dehydrogenase [Chloroflexota bacterium]
MSKRVTVMGGGMGGYGAAIRAAQLGAQVVLIEKDALGGTCLNRGCIPTKALLHSANMFALMKKAQTLGVSAKEVSLDYAAVLRRKEAIVSRLVGGVSSLMRKNKIRVIKGTGSLADAQTVVVTGTDEAIRGDAIIIATGARPALLPIKGIDQPGVIISDDALVLPEVPASLFIIGGGAVGLEFAQIFHRLGSKVTVAELLSHILPAQDAEIAGILHESLAKSGIEIFTEANVTGIETTDKNERKVRFVTKQGEQERTVAKVLVAVGRKPNTEGLGLEKAGIKLERGRITVNAHMETSVRGVYAVGDVVGGMMLAHVAMSEGTCAAENILGQDSVMRYSTIPSCIYTSPEIATVGLTEAEARKEDPNIKVGRFPFMANGRALILDESEGMVKIITNRYGEVVGVSIIGPEATELIAEVTLARHFEAGMADIISCIHAHPTLSEVIREAAMSTEGRAVHI